MSKVFWVSSTVRSVQTRLTRALAPERARFKQYILGGSLRLVRNRPLVISELQLKHFKPELEAKWKAGLIEVREGAPDGPVYLFEKKKRRKSTPPPPMPPTPVVEEPKPEPEPEPAKLEDPPTAKETKAAKMDEFVPVEEPVQRKRGRKPKKG